MSNLPKISNLSDWYNEVVTQAELACHGPVRGTMVIRPYGCAVWEIIQKKLDERIKATGHQNAIFPLLIPESFLHKEAEHVEGFSPELAVVTHAGGKKLEEPLVIRPTSETIIYSMFAQWIKSWRDLPLKLNQWANVVRWEMRPRLFLRTTEFFWQEGHTAHETALEADTEAELMINEYANLLQKLLAIPVFMGKKSNSEKFAGAEYTLTCEAIMPDGKALQMCTSHRIKQQFGTAFKIQFQDKTGNLAYPYYTSWGFTTRSIGALIMMHGDDKGLILPPNVAPYQIVIIPIIRQDTKEIVMACVAQLQKDLKDFRVYVDDTDERPGAKFYNWELKGVPLRLEIGARDVLNEECTLVSRANSQKSIVKLANIKTIISDILLNLQAELLERAQTRTHNLVKDSANLDCFQDILETNSAIRTYWCGDHKCEAQLKRYQASIRCILESFTENNIEHKCFACSELGLNLVLIAKSY